MRLLRRSTQSVDFSALVEGRKYGRLLKLLSCDDPDITRSAVEALTFLALDNSAKEARLGSAHAPSGQHQSFFPYDRYLRKLASRKLGRFFVELKPIVKEFNAEKAQLLREYEEAEAPYERLRNRLHSLEWSPGWSCVNELYDLLEANEVVHNAAEISVLEHVILTNKRIIGAHERGSLASYVDFGPMIRFENAKIVEERREWLPSKTRVVDQKDGSWIDFPEGASKRAQKILRRIEERVARP